MASRQSNGRSTGRRAVTMNDVAQAAGVAQSTVSRILNDAPVPIPVSQETRARVLGIANQLGYRPDPIARALRGAPTMLLGAVVRDITDPFFAVAVEALSIEAKERGYSVVIGHARAAADEALVLTAVLEARHCDGIVLLGDFHRERHLVEDLRKTHARVVGLWHGTWLDSPFPTVGVDNAAGIRAALDHLTSLGHRQIAFVGAEMFGDEQARQRAYREHMAQIGHPAPAGYVHVTSNTIDGGRAALAPLLALRPRPTAVITATDVLAMGVLYGAYECGVGIPGELSIVGFDNIPMAAATVPGLTTVAMPMAEIVGAGVELSVGTDRWAGDGEVPHRVFEPPLVVRGTSGPAPA
jgi:DNA-binding LacI/PurR family transcriptional regulator